MSVLSGPAARLARFSRLVGIGRNPLRRTSDRIEGAVLAVVVVACLAAIPAGVITGRAVVAGGQRTATRLAAAGHPTAAVLLADPWASSASDQPPADVPVRARWSLGGHTYTGTIRVAPGRHRGDTVPIRVDRTGRPLPAPESATRIVSEGIGAGLAVLFGTVSVALLFWWSVRWLLDRRRYADWAGEWRAGRCRDVRRRRPGSADT